MTVMKKAYKANYRQTDVEELIEEKKFDDVINRGGKTSDESTQRELKPSEEEVRFTLRIPAKLIEKIDAARAPRVGNVSRNQWILEVIHKSLE